jgi:E3 ubiquitin-protein ligase mind-bomb
LGKIGRVLQVYPDNDLKVEVCGTSWTYNPLALTKVTNPTQPVSNPSDERMSTLLKTLFETHITGDANEELVKAAANDDAKKCESILSLSNGNVDGTFAGHTSLQAACQNGHLNTVKVLLNFNADLEIEVSCLSICLLGHERLHVEKK